MTDRKQKAPTKSAADAASAPTGDATPFESRTPVKEADVSAADGGKQKKNAGPKNTGKAKSPDKPGASIKITMAKTTASLAKLDKKVRKHSDDKLLMVPVDFSEPSASALQFAAQLADSISAALLVVHVVHDPGEMPGYYAKLVKKKRVGRIQDIAREVFDGFLAKARDENPEVKSLREATNMMVMGLPVTRILQLAEKLEPFLVVMGSQGRTGLKHLFLGSKAEQVVQLCQAPVTIVKQDRKQHKRKG